MKDFIEIVRTGKLKEEDGLLLGLFNPSIPAHFHSNTAKILLASTPHL